jgi:hypothetical protein
MFGVVSPRHLLLPFLLALVVAGCGDDGGGETTETPQTIDGLRACLDADGRYDPVEPIVGGPGDTALTGRERRVVQQAVRDAEGGLIARWGGPEETADGTIVEAPVIVEEVYVFGDEGAAKAAAAKIEPATGPAPDNVLSAARPLGRAVIVHYSFGIGDEAGGVALDENALEPVQRCLEAAGYA